MGRVAAHFGAWLFAVAAGFAFALSLHAFQPHEHAALPNFERRNAVASAAANPGKSNALAGLRARVPGARAAVSGGVRHVAAGRSFLTGSGGTTGGGVSGAFAAVFPATDPHRGLKAFLDEHRAAFGHGAEALQTGAMRRDAVNARTGLRSSVWQQELEGLPVFGAVLAAHTTSRGELAAVATTFVPDLAAAAGKVPNRAARLASPAISARGSVVRAAANVGESVALQLLQRRAAQAGGGERFTGGGLIDDAEPRLTWYPLDDETLRLCWEVIVTRREGCEMFRVLVDAEDGQILLRHCLTSYLSPASYRVFTSDSPTPFSPGHPTPLSAQPPTLARTLVTLDALNTTASPNGWINDGGNETLGNNVAAHLDRNANNQPDLPRPSGSPARVFDFPLDLAQAPTTADNQRAAVVNLFYLCNWIHDRLYELGFDEASGNFQTDNFGRGGLGGDAVQADAQDGAGSNNANFSTLPDGFAPRMQMFLWTAPNPDRDGDFDAEIVIHEYIHGLSNRRVGGGVLISALQTVGMGEGWSDFYALSLLSEPGDDPGGNYALGGYATRDWVVNAVNSNNYYFGVRRYPYSTNRAANPLTFRDIDPSQAAAHAGVPRSPVLPNTADSVHNMGEVWCSALWDARARLIARDGFATGNELILQLVTDGMALCPPNPNFLEARDGILLADMIATGGANQLELWGAFAGRGMGFSAQSPPSGTTAGVVEAFDLPDDLRISPVATGVSQGPVGGPFVPQQFVFTLSNAGPASLDWSLSASAAWLTLDTTGGTLAPQQISSVTSLVNAAALALPAGVYTNRLSFTNAASGLVQRRTVLLRVGQTDHLTEQFSGGGDPFDLALNSITFTPDGSPAGYTVCLTPVAGFYVSPANHTTGTFGDDSFVQLTLSGGKTVALHGVSRSTLFVGSNGYLTLDSGDTQYQQSAANHFNLRRVSGVFTDLNPTASPNGRVSFAQLPDRFVATWQRIVQYGTSNENTFQIEWFFDGRIRITWLNASAVGLLSGLSRGGGVPANYAESDLSQGAVCRYPAQLVLPATLTEGAGALAGAGRVTLPEPLLTTVVVELLSSEPGLVSVPPSVSIPIGQTSAVFDVTVGNNATADADRTVFVSVDGPLVMESSQPVTVLDDEPHVLLLTAPARVEEGGGVVPGVLRVRSTVPVSGAVTVTLGSTDAARIAVPATVEIPAAGEETVVDIGVGGNGVDDGPTPVTLTAAAPGWSNAVSVVGWLEDELRLPGGGAFAVDIGTPVKFPAVPFDLAVAALDAAGGTNGAYAGRARIEALAAAPDALTPVRVLSFSAFVNADIYPQIFLAAQSGFGGFETTHTVVTNRGVLRYKLESNEVLLVADQFDPVEEIGADWSGVVREFVSRGGVVVVLNNGGLSLDWLNATGLMHAELLDTFGTAALAATAPHPLNAGVAPQFTAEGVSVFASTNAVPVVTPEEGPGAVVLARAFGLGSVVLIGTDYSIPGGGLDRLLANALQGVQAARRAPVAFAPVGTGAFSAGLWNGSGLFDGPAAGVVLRASDGFGASGLSVPFVVRTNTPPVAIAANLFAEQGAKTNLLVSASDPDFQPLTFTLVALPTNGLVAATNSGTGVFVYTPAHGFTGGDGFTFVVSDGMATSAVAVAAITVQPAPDMNMDGIPDAWQTLNGFSLMEPTAHLDLDGDGLTALQEYFANSNPDDVRSGPITPSVEMLPGGKLMLRWTGIGGVRYRVRWSAGDGAGNFSGAFTDLLRPVTAEMNPAPSGVPQDMTFTDDFTLTGGAPTNGVRYFQIQTTR